MYDEPGFELGEGAGNIDTGNGRKPRNQNARLREFAGYSTFGTGTYTTHVHGALPLLNNTQNRERERRPRPHDSMPIRLTRTKQPADSGAWATGQGRFCGYARADGRCRCVTNGPRQAVESQHSARIEGKSW